MKTKKNMTMSAKSISPTVSPETGPSKCPEAFTRPRRRRLANTGTSAAKIAGACCEIDSTKLDFRPVDAASPVAARLDSIFRILTQTGHIVTARVIAETPDILRGDRSYPSFHTATEETQVRRLHQGQAN